MNVRCLSRFGDTSEMGSGFSDFHVCLLNSVFCLSGRWLVVAGSADLRVTDRSLPVHSGGGEEFPVRSFQVSCAKILTLGQPTRCCREVFLASLQVPRITMRTKMDSKKMPKNGFVDPRLWNTIFAAKGKNKCLGSWHKTTHNRKHSGPWLADPCWEFHRNADCRYSVLSFPGEFSSAVLQCRRISQRKCETLSCGFSPRILTGDLAPEGRTRWAVREIFCGHFVMCWRQWLVKTVPLSSTYNTRTCIRAPSHSHVQKDKIYTHTHSKMNSHIWYAPFWCSNFVRQTAGCTWVITASARCVITPVDISAFYLCVWRASVWRRL